MSKEQEIIIREYKSIEETIYYIVQNKGKELLYDFLIARKLKLKKVKPITIKDNKFLPSYLEEIIKEKGNDLDLMNEIFIQYENIFINRCIKTINEDWDRMHFEANIAQISSQFRNYFYTKFNYLKIYRFFELTLKVIEELASNTFKTLPEEIRQRIVKRMAKLREQERERVSLSNENRKKGEKDNYKIVYYHLLDDKILNPDYSPIKFSLFFDGLEEIEFNGISLKTIPLLEEEMESIANEAESSKKESEDPKLENRFINLKKNIEKYKKKKYEIETLKFRKSFKALLKKIESHCLKINKKFFKIVYEYETSLVREYKEKQKLFF